MPQSDRMLPHGERRSPGLPISVARFALCPGSAISRQIFQGKPMPISKFDRTIVRSAVRRILAGTIVAGASLAAVSAEDSGTLDEVVVTAQFRQQSVQD